MGTGWSEWPLVFFTVLSQCVIGGFGVMAWALGRSEQDAAQVRALHWQMLYLWLMMGIAFSASILHLGMPLRALNALNQLGTSPLSMEIASGSLFFALGGLYWLLAMLGKLSPSIRQGWLAVTGLVGAAFLYAMCRVYTIETVPTWDTPYTALSFLLTALLGGSLLGYLLLHAAGASISGALRLLPAVALCALVASSVFGFGQLASLGQIQSSVQHAATLIPDIGTLTGIRLILLSTGLACWLVPLLKAKTPSIGWMMASFMLVLAGELLGRSLFYGLHMTVGMAYGS